VGSWSNLRRERKLIGGGGEEKERMNGDPVLTLSSSRDCWCQWAQYTRKAKGKGRKTRKKGVWTEKLRSSYQVEFERRITKEP